MADIKLQLKLLQDALHIKLKTLNEIEEMTIEQSKILQLEGSYNEKLEDIATKKQTLIDQILTIDNGFKSTYDRIKGVLATQPDLYKYEIHNMQSLIREIGEKDIAIQVSERRNETQLTLRLRLPQEKKMSQRMNSQSITNYYTSMKSKKLDNTSSAFDESK